GTPPSPPPASPPRGRPRGAAGAPRARLGGTLRPRPGRARRCARASRNVARGSYPQPMPRAAAIYCRISDDRQGHALGVTRQEQDCRALADRKGWPIADVYVDNDLSAYNGKNRPSYRRLLDDIKAQR